MSKGVTVKLNSAGVRELLRSPEMMQTCKKYATEAQGRLGEGYEVTTHTGKNRVNASVAAVTPAAKRECLKNNTIIKAVIG